MGWPGSRGAHLAWLCCTIFRLFLDSRLRIQLTPWEKDRLSTRLETPGRTRQPGQKQRLVASLRKRNEPISIGYGLVGNRKSACREPCSPSKKNAHPRSLAKSTSRYSDYEAPEQNSQCKSSTECAFGHTCTGQTNRGPATSAQDTTQPTHTPHPPAAGGRSAATSAWRW